MCDFVRNTRKKHGLTQQQLADLIGVSKGYVYQLEKGRRPLTDSMKEAIEALDRSDTQVRESVSNIYKTRPVSEPNKMIARIDDPGVSAVGEDPLFEDVELGALLLAVIETCQNFPESHPIRAKLEARNLQALVIAIQEKVSTQKD